MVACTYRARSCENSKFGSDVTFKKIESKFVENYFMNTDKEKVCELVKKETRDT